MWSWFFLFFILKHWCVVDLQRCVNFRHTAKWFKYRHVLYIYIYTHTHTHTYITCIFFFRFFSLIGFRVPCAIQQVLVNYLFYTQYCNIYINSKLLIYPSPFLNCLSKGKQILCLRGYKYFPSLSLWHFLYVAVELKSFIFTWYQLSISPPNVFGVNQW